MSNETLQFITGAVVAGLLGWFFCWVGFKKAGFLVTPWTLFVAAGMPCLMIFIPYCFIVGFTQKPWWGIAGAALLNVPIVLWWWRYIRRREQMITRIQKALWKTERTRL